MEVDFSVLNQKGNPAFYQDTFALRPAAGYAGRIFIATDTGNLYRDNGTTWTQIATGGGGGSVSVGVGLTGDGSVGNPLESGIDTIMAAAQLLTATRDVGLNGFNFRFMSGATQIAAIRDNGTATIGLTSNRLNLTSTGAFTLGNATNHGIEHDATGSSVKMGYFSGTNYPYIISRGATNILQTYIGTTERGIYVDTTKTVVGLYGTNANCLYIDSNSIGCKSSNNNGGFFADFANNLWKFGDWTGFNSYTAAYIEISNGSGGDWLKTYFGANVKGLDFDYTNDIYKFGSFNGVGPTINMDPTPYIEMIVENPIRLNDNNTQVMYSTTAGTSAGYLIVNYNGTDYKIEILDNA